MNIIVSGSWIHSASDLAGCTEPLPERNQAVRGDRGKWDRLKLRKM